jgi:hypothetical protein
MNERTGILGLAVLIAALVPVPSRGHDTWVQVAAGAVRPGDVVHVDLFLGNHGNGHRDFKIAGKLGSLEGATLAVVGPDGNRTDLRPDLVDLGTAANEGFWSGRFVAVRDGLHCAAFTRDGIRHGARGIKSAKAYFLVAERLDAAPPVPGDAAVPLGHPLELVLESHPVLDCGPGREIVVRLLHHGQPLAAERVSFIPRGATLAAGFDPAFERMTDAEGRCRYAPQEGNLLLVVARRVQPEERGAGYDKTAYTATLVLDVPQRRRGRD